MRSAAEAAPSFLHLPHVAGAPDEFALPPEEARYAARVVRARVGESLRASDGAGTVVELVVEALRPELRVRVSERLQSPPRPARVLLCGAPEGERGDWLVEKLAELGVTRLVPVDTERAAWPGRGRESRWQRLTVAALRQSRSPWRMEIGDPTPLEPVVESLEPCGRWLADPAGRPAGERRIAAREPLVGAVGGSRGFTEAERNFLSQLGFEPVVLAANRLRTETAAVAMAALWEGLATAAGGRLDVPFHGS